jgi:hypothetical protein
MLIYFVANWAVKMSILALYARIGRTARSLPLTVQPRAIWTTAGLISAFTLAVILVQIFSCIPVEAAWNIQQLRVMCVDGLTFMQVQGGINVFTDVVLLLYPLPLLRVLKFNRRQRSMCAKSTGCTSLFWTRLTITAALIIIFSIGLIPVIASSMRLCEIVMSGNAVKPGMGWQGEDSSWCVLPPPHDKPSPSNPSSPSQLYPPPSLISTLIQDIANKPRTWAWVPIWSQIEVDIGVLTACLPCLSPLLVLFYKSTHTKRAVTPSMVSLPKYSGGLGSSIEEDEKEGKGELALGEGRGKEGEVKWTEKELPAIPGEYYDGASDEEEARDTTMDRPARHVRRVSRS